MLGRSQAISFVFSAGLTELICRWQPEVRNFLLGRDSIFESQNGKLLNFPAYSRPAEFFLDLGMEVSGLINSELSQGHISSGIAFTLRASGIRIATHSSA